MDCASNKNLGDALCQFHSKYVSAAEKKKKKLKLKLFILELIYFGSLTVAGLCHV